MGYIAAVLTVAALVTLSEGVSMKCAWGPSYWCQSDSTANECGKLKYCQETVWEVKEEKVDGSIECTLCKLVINKIEGITENNATELEVMVEIKKICPFLGPLQAKCNSFIEANFENLWKVVTKELNGQEICQVIKMCPQVQLKSVKDGAECSLCKMAVGKIEELMESENATVIKADIEKICMFLPGASKNDCISFINENFDLVWNMIEKEMSTDAICVEIKMCSSSVKRAPVSKVKSVECTVCTTVVTFLKHFLDENGTENEAKSAVEKLCDLLPSSVSGNCTELVKEYFGFIWMLLKDEVESGKVCEQIGVCNSTVTTTTPVKPQLSPESAKADLCDYCKLAVSFLRPFVDNTGDEAKTKASLETACGLLPGNASTECKGFVDMYFDKIWVAVKGEVDSGDLCQQIKLCNSTSEVTKVRVSSVKADVCSLCELAVSFLKPFVDENSTETEVKDAIEKVCDILPSALKDECTTLFDTYFDIIWQLVESEFDNDLICKQLKLCNSTLAKQHVKPVPHQLSSVEDSVCDICKLVVNYIKPFVDSNSTEAEVKKGLEVVCSLLPGSYKQECTTLVDTDFDTIWKLVKDGIDSGDACKEIGLCNSTLAKIGHPSNAPLVKSVKSPDAGIECILCEFVMKEVDSLLNGNTSEAAVVAALDKVCSILPKTILSECDALVKQYAPDIIKLLINETDPKTICTKLTLCTSKAVALTQPKAGVECVMCEFVIRQLESLITKNSTEAEIVKAIEKVCSLLPKTIRSECDALVEKYGPKIFELLVKDADPKEVCTLINLCTATKPVLPKLQGGPLCVICEYVLERLAGMINVNSTEKEVKKALEEVCSVFPSSIRKECDDFVMKYTDDILKAIVNGAGPKVVCSILKLCLFSSQQQQQQATSLLKNPKSDGLCSVCKLTLSAIKDVIDTKPAQGEVEAALDKACGLLPNELTAECIGIVKSYGPQIIQILDEEINPESFCKDVKLCSSKSSKKATALLMKPWLKMARSRDL